MPPSNRGRVTGEAVPAAEFMVTVDGQPRPALEVLRRGNYYRQHKDDPDKAEHFVPIRWLQTVPVTDAVDEVGFFGNQNTICRPTTASWRSTVERLKTLFPRFNDQ